MQPTGRSGPVFRAGAALLEAKQWKRWLVRAGRWSPAADAQAVRQQHKCQLLREL